MTSLNTLEDDVIDTYYVAHINTTVVQLIFHFDFSIKDDVEIVVSVIIYDVCIYIVDVEMGNNVGGIYIVDVVFISIIITHDALNNIDDVELLNNVGSK